MSVDLIALWHSRARPQPTKKDLAVQLGCHVEEFLEMLDSIEFTYRRWNNVRFSLNELATALKNGDESIADVDRKELLDSLADQVVTAVGVSHCASMHITEAVRRVNTSNWTKFDMDGQPIRHPGGKIAKGPNYKEPDLDGLY